MSNNIVTQESYEVVVLRNKHGQYFSKLAEPVKNLRQAWRFSNMADATDVFNFQHYAPPVELEYKPVRVKVTMITVEVEVETE